MGYESFSVFTITFSLLSNVHPSHIFLHTPSPGLLSSSISTASLSTLPSFLIWILQFPLFLFCFSRSCRWWVCRVGRARLMRWRLRVTSWPGATTSGGSWRMTQGDPTLPHSPVSPFATAFESFNLSISYAEKLSRRMYFKLWWKLTLLLSV